MARVRSMFFFFQAEDGIRDTSVTGVQTCALPIFSLRICIDQEGSLFSRGEACCKVHGSCSLTDPALLVCDCDDARHEFQGSRWRVIYPRSVDVSTWNYGSVFHVEIAVISLG